MGILEVRKEIEAFRLALGPDSSVRVCAERLMELFSVVSDLFFTSEACKQNCTHPVAGPIFLEHNGPNSKIVILQIRPFRITVHEAPTIQMMFELLELRMTGSMQLPSSVRDVSLEELNTMGITPFVLVNYIEANLDRIEMIRAAEMATQQAAHA